MIVRIFRCVTIVFWFIMPIVMLSCSSESGDAKKVSSYILSINDNIKAIDNLYLSEKYIANPDSVSITDYVLRIKDVSEEAIEQKMWLLMGNEIYFTFSNQNITGKQLRNIIKTSKQYKTLGIQPSTFIIFSIVQYTDEYGHRKTGSLAFLLDSNGEIIRHKIVVPCVELMDMFSEEDIKHILEYD